MTKDESGFYQRIKRVGIRALEQATKRFNLWRGAKHDTSEYAAEDYYAKVYVSYMSQHATGMYDGNDTLKILDVGCGVGRFAIDLARRGHDVTGIDLLPDKIEKAQRRANERGVTINLRRGDVESDLAEMPGGQYDVIMCLEVLNTVSKYREVMRELRRLLAPQGILFCTHRPKHYYITTLLEQGRLKAALRVARSKDGVLPMSNRPIYYNWHTKEGVEELYSDLNMRVRGLHSIGTFSGFGVDGLAPVANPETMSEKEKEILFELETEELDDYVATGRYMLAASTKL